MQEDEHNIYGWVVAAWRCWEICHECLVIECVSELRLWTTEQLSSSGFRVFRT